MTELTFICMNATATYRTLIEMHIGKVEYHVSSKYDEKGKIIFYVSCKVEDNKAEEFKQIVYAHVHA